MRLLLLLLAPFVLTISCTEPNKTNQTTELPTIQNPTNKVILSSEIDWEQLNPARGDKSPQAGTIWGDRKGTAPTGFLAKFVDGFSSPPHIHNVTYRAVVIKGKIHNDDPNAENMWMTPGSFWTQPEGESHITSAQGQENIALVEIDHGPYLVKPLDEAFDNGERPINIDASNIVWLNHTKTNWIAPDTKAEMSFLWQDQNNHQGLFIKLPKAFKGKLVTNGDVLHAVIIQGDLNYTLPQTNEIQTLDAGSYFTSNKDAIHSVSNTSQNDVILYIRTNGHINMKNE